MHLKIIEEIVEKEINSMEVIAIQAWFMKLGLIGQLIGILALGLIAIIIIANLFVCLMSWRSGHGFLWWKD